MRPNKHINVRQISAALKRAGMTVRSQTKHDGMKVRQQFPGAMVSAFYADQRYAIEQGEIAEQVLTEAGYTVTRSILHPYIVHVRDVPVSKAEKENAMDPNVLLKEMRDLAKELLLVADGQESMPDQEVKYKAFELAEKFEALDEWRMKGGYLPEDWYDPQV